MVGGRSIITVGVDVGSAACKAVVFDAVEGRVLGTALAPTGWHPRERGEEVFRAAVERSGCRRDDLHAVVGTGYGRSGLPFATCTVTEITCHARAAAYLVPGAATVIDVGGQDCKVISLGSDGHVRDFVMNDRCAAGTGRFLEVMARAMDVSLERFGEIALTSDRPAQISSTCVVFAESEVVSLLAAGAAREDVVAGIHDAIARRILAMAGKLRIVQEVVLTGGGGLSAGLKWALERNLGHPVRVAPMPQYAGALGAALLGIG